MIFALGARPRLGAEGGNLAATLERNIKMLRTITLSSIAAILAISGFAFGVSIVAAVSQEAPADYQAAPIFPADKVSAVKPAPVTPKHATHKVQSGVKSFRFVACRESRDVRGNQERRCLSWGKNGWSKSPKWVPAYQLLALN